MRSLTLPIRSMLQTTIVETLNQLPESLQAEVLHYAEFLADRHHKSITPAASNQAGAPKPQAPNELSAAANGSRLHRKQGVLVVETGQASEFDINALVGEMREERIQDQTGQVNRCRFYTIPRC
jgi:hypothetical protein